MDGKRFLVFFSVDKSNNLKLFNLPFCVVYVRAVARACSYCCMRRTQPSLTYSRGGGVTLNPAVILNQESQICFIPVRFSSSLSVCKYQYIYLVYSYSVFPLFHFILCTVLHTVLEPILGDLGSITGAHIQRSIWECLLA